MKNFTIYLGPSCAISKTQEISLVKEWVCMRELKGSPAPIFNSPKNHIQRILIRSHPLPLMPHR